MLPVVYFRILITHKTSGNLILLDEKIQRNHESSGGFFSNKKEIHEITVRLKQGPGFYALGTRSGKFLNDYEIRRNNDR